MKKRISLRVSAAILLFIVAILGESVTAKEVRDDSRSIDVYLAGIKIANVNIATRTDGTSYAVSSIIKSVGGINLFARVDYRGKVRGWVRESGFEPVGYMENSNFRGNETNRELKYTDGIPTVFEDGRQMETAAGRADPSMQGGTLDPLTVFHALTRDVDITELCGFEVFAFDGKRRTKIDVSEPRRKGNAVVCTANYTRIDGFSAEQMKKQTVFPFELKYIPLGGNRFRMKELSTPTKLGKLRLSRKR